MGRPVLGSICVPPFPTGGAGVVGASGAAAGAVLVLSPARAVADDKLAKAKDSARNKVVRVLNRFFILLERYACIFSPCISQITAKCLELSFSSFSTGAVAIPFDASALFS